MKTLIGIDWSSNHHDVRLHNERGACLARFSIPHTLAGFQQLAAKIARLNPNPSDCLIAIESADSLLVDFLWSGQYRLYVLAPSVVKGNRSRQRASGARDDDRDAALLAEILRTDRHALIAWQPDGPLVSQMRLLFSSIDDLTASIVQYGNRLRLTLWRYYPQVLDAFSSVDVPLGLHFLLAYPTPATLISLSYDAFCAFCRQHGDRRADFHARRFGRLQQPTPAVSPDLLPALAQQTGWLAQHLLGLVTQKASLLKQVETRFAAHPDQPIFDSLPGAGDILGPKLLIMFGDHRARLPTPAVIQALAGTCPVTDKSGKSCRIYFRRACNHAFRTTAQQFAQASLPKSPWATAYYERARRRGLRKSHAYRCLANRWLAIIWTLWQRRQPYDPAYHWQQVHHHRLPA